MSKRKMAPYRKIFPNWNRPPGPSVPEPGTVGAKIIKEGSSVAR